MKRALVAIVLLAATGITAAAEFNAKDLVGAWTTGVADKDYAYHNFFSNFTYTGWKGDMDFEGKWKLRSGNRLQLSGQEVILINSFDGNILRVTLPNGKEDVWKKMPWWRGSPAY
jgi:hypothetical protein